MAIDRHALGVATTYITAMGGKLGKNIKHLLDDSMATAYHDANSERVAERCMTVLRYYWTNGVNRQTQKEFLCVLEYVAQLVDNSAVGIDYTGKDKTIETFITTGKGGSFMAKNNNWFESSIDSVKKYILENIRVLEVFRTEAERHEDSETADNISRTIEAYQRMSDQVERLRDTVVDHQEEVARSLSSIKNIVVGNRAFIKSGEYAANLDMGNEDSCFVQIDNHISEALAVYQEPTKRHSAPAGYSEYEVEHHGDDDFANLIAIAGKRKTYDELYRSIENRLARKGGSAIDQQLEKKKRELAAAEAEEEKYDRMVENGEMSEEDADFIFDALEDKIEGLQADISDLTARKADGIQADVDKGIIWNVLVSEIQPFMDECSPIEFMQFADTIIDALRNVNNYLNGNVQAGQNSVSLQSATECVEMLRALRVQETAARAKVREETRREREEVRAQMRQLRPQRIRETGGGRKGELTGRDRRRARMEQRDSARRSAADRAIDPTLPESDKPIVSGTGSINDDD